MSTNLRLSDDLTEALRATSLRTGRSQQDIVRTALAKELGLHREMGSLQRAVQAGLVEPPEPFMDVEPSLRLVKGESTLGLLDRDER